MSKEKKKCEEEKEKMIPILQDIKVTARDINDIKKSKEMKKTIQGFEGEIDHYCDEDNLKKRK